MVQTDPIRSVQNLRKLIVLGQHSIDPHPSSHDTTLLLVHSHLVRILVVICTCQCRSTSNSMLARYRFQYFHLSHTHLDPLFHFVVVRVVQSSLPTYAVVDWELDSKFPEELYSSKTKQTNKCELRFSIVVPSRTSLSACQANFQLSPFRVLSKFTNDSTSNRRSKRLTLWCTLVRKLAMYAFTNHLTSP